ncbi:hypothetical protein LZ32DRAFT_423929 [Colletotrichum eremochloae]|nr:hypothetical protein LZ32DRAFT_423929 [Colletotrichum eremochloae]
MSPSRPEKICDQRTLTYHSESCNKSPFNGLLFDFIVPFCADNFESLLSSLVSVVCLSLQAMIPAALGNFHCWWCEPESSFLFADFLRYAVRCSISCAFVLTEAKNIQKQARVSVQVLWDFVRKIRNHSKSQQGLCEESTDLHSSCLDTVGQLAVPSIVLHFILPSITRLAAPEDNKSTCSDIESGIGFHKGAVSA